MKLCSILITATAALCLSLTSAQNPVCSLTDTAVYPNKPDNPTHTLCLYSGPNRNCQFLKEDSTPVNLNTNPTLSNGITPHDESLIIGLHNVKRAEVASGSTRFPAADKMRALIWDDKLAYIAARWVHQCNLSYDTLRDYPKDVQVNQLLYVVNENLAMSTPGANWEGAFKIWYSQFANLDISIINRFAASPKWFFVSQMLWANTDKIGCAFTRYIDPSNPAKVVKLYGCNYSPAGKIVGQPIYKTTTLPPDCTGLDPANPSNPVPPRGYLCYPP